MRLSTPLSLTCALALAVGISATASANEISEPRPPLAAHAAAPEGFVPAEWSLWQIRKGDLNNDGISDAVLIMARGNSEGPYRLAVVFGNAAGGFDLKADNSELLANAPDDDIRAYPVSDGLKIRHGAFTIGVQREGPGGAATITFTFRHLDGRFILIGYDYLGSHHGWLNLSFNMLTGQIIETEGDFQEGRERVAEKRRAGKFAPPKLMDLKTLGHAFAFNESFSPFKYAPRDSTR